MLYLSQTLNSRVEDNANARIGRLKDILVEIKPGAYSPLAFLLVRNKKGDDLFIPFDYCENLSPHLVSLKASFEKITLATPSNNCIYLNRDVLDQQIVDVDGARVVRVNDISLGIFENKMCVLGVDVSFKGILRRLGFEWVDVFGWAKVHLIDWRKTQSVKGVLKLDTISKDLTKLHPADLANIVEDLNFHYGTKLVNTLGSKEAAKVLEEINPHLQKILIKHLGPEKATRIIEKMSVDEIADLMQLFSQREAQKYLSLLQEAKSKKVEKLIRYEDDSAGGLMNSDFITAKPEWTAVEAIEEIRLHSPNMRSIMFIYVTDETGKLLGPISLRNLLLAKDDQKLSTLYKSADKLAVLKPHYSLEKIVNIMTKYDLFSAAVINGGGRIVGIVTIDDVMRCLAPKA
ncbi:MAG: CBS domain-containing protein [Candidatus Magasanikbacteria bacterium]